ncbi:Tryparedoxin-like protein [Leptomonas seymouri]|uniref:Tryparedoxin-like protein n=1 Tax=Leptomonas seymouri TaxID=5684 RepID=A0A0N0P6T6_LEPSE|nr:Tryparedoxin-like protein [Leptomonas seymouri]|eukprot:KPI87547.1 Tryparedoxin-like protein [Leptomonas seymouri]
MNYFGQWPNLELVRQDGTTRLVADVLRDVPYVVLLFGASWNAETEKFFPLIERFYEHHHLMKGFEVVYISRDYSKAEMMRGFLLDERAITAAERQQRRERKKERHRCRCLSSDLPTKDHAGGANAQDVGRDDTKDGSASSSSPPPLKRIAELAPVKATSSFSVCFPSPTSNTVPSSNPLEHRKEVGGIWAVPYEHVGIIGVPILYHLRVFSYPGVVVCRNKPLHPSVIPQLLKPAPGKLQNGKDEVGEAAARCDVANAPQRHQKTPKVARRECYPDVVTITGRFMIETEDPTGEHFPWAHMSSKVRFAALLFFAVVIAVTAVVLGVLLPATAGMRHAKRGTTPTARLL